MPPEDTEQTRTLDLHINVILTGNDLLTAALEELPFNVRGLVEAHFFDGESIFKIQRYHKIRRRKIEASITSALERMRTYMLHRDVQAVNDLI